jgi:hypothetical protein
METFRTGCFALNGAKFNFIADNSCEFDGRYFSNNKFVITNCLKDDGIITDNKIITDNEITNYKNKCELVDKITHNLDVIIYNDFDEGSVYYKEFAVWLDTYCSESYNIHFANDWEGSTFNTFEEFYDYIHINYPHFIINHDIKN